METLEMEKYPKISKKFICKKCNYICSKNNECTKRLVTAKHLGGNQWKYKNLRPQKCLLLCGLWDIIKT